MMRDAFHKNCPSDAAAGDRGFDPLRLATIKPSAVVDPKDGLPWYKNPHQAQVTQIVMMLIVGSESWRLTITP
jgi:hypothetical protein